MGKVIIELIYNFCRYIEYHQKQ